MAHAHAPFASPTCPLSDEERASLTAWMATRVCGFWRREVVVPLSAFRGLAAARASNMPPYVEMRDVLYRESPVTVYLWAQELETMVADPLRRSYVLKRLGLRGRALDEDVLRDAIQSEVTRIAGVAWPIVESFGLGTYSVAGPREAWFCVGAGTDTVRARRTMLAFLRDLSSMP